MRHPSAKLPDFGTEPLLVEPQTALGHLKPVLDAGTELLKRHNGGEDFVPGKYEAWLGRFKGAAINCFGHRSIAAAYSQEPIRIDSITINVVRRTPSQDEAAKDSRTLVEGVEKSVLPVPNFIRGPDETFVDIDRLRGEVATLEKWVRSLARQARKKRPGAVG